MDNIDKEARQAIKEIQIKLIEIRELLEQLKKMTQANTKHSLKEDIIIKQIQTDVRGLYEEVDAIKDYIAEKAEAG